MLLPKDAADEKNAILEIRAGTGGDEAALFAADLFRMYQRYAELKGWRFGLMQASDTGIGGFKEAIAEITGKGVFVDFFGFPASTVRGPGIFAIRTGVPVLFCDPRRLPGSKVRYRIRFSPILYEPADDLEENVHRLTRAYMASLEEVIRESPEQYFWFHKRWKTQPEVREPGSSVKVAQGTPEDPSHAEHAQGDAD